MLFVGNFVFLYLNVAGSVQRGYYGLAKYALLSPLYWGLMSLAAWKGFLQLITKPVLLGEDDARPRHADGARRPRRARRAPPRARAAGSRPRPGRRRRAAAARDRTRGASRAVEAA